MQHTCMHAYMHTIYIQSSTLHHHTIQYSALIALHCITPNSKDTCICRCIRICIAKIDVSEYAYITHRNAYKHV